MVLDIVEVPVNHTGANLALVFADVLKEFGIMDKVSLYAETEAKYLAMDVQILSITCDNATNNDSMIQELACLIPDYSAVNRSRCFLHIVNLIAKSLIKQFDTPNNATANIADAALVEIAAGMEIDDMIAAANHDDGGGATSEDGDMEDDPDDQVNLDVAEILGVEDGEALNDAMRPVKLILAKVSL
jgi:hypothetical protein